MIKVKTLELDELEKVTVAIETLTILRNKVAMLETVASQQASHIKYLEDSDDKREIERLSIIIASLRVELCQENNKAFKIRKLRDVISTQAENRLHFKQLRNKYSALKRKHSKLKAAIYKTINMAGRIRIKLFMRKWDL